MGSRLAELTAIRRQSPMGPSSRKSVANFKVRAGMKLAPKVTLRARPHVQFTDKLMNIVCPAFRDFPRVSAKPRRPAQLRAVRSRTDNLPEIEYDKGYKIRGRGCMIFVTTAKTDEEARELSTQWACPLRKA
jgi:large subunit ribosomal protein L5